MALIASILSKFDDSGIKKAKSEFGGLKKVLGGIAVGAALKQVADVLIDAGKAASADQKSMQLLNNQLKKNAGATNAQIKANNKFIDTLSNQVGIVDDDLRPAMGKFVRVTKDTGKAQGLLKLALDASAYAGQPLEKVSVALSKAYTGNTTALIRMFPELKKSKDIIGDLTNVSEGYAVKQADPFARLNVAMDNLKEKLGYIILPYIETFINEFTKPGGMGDQVSKFLDDIGNPKTDVGATFVQIKDAVNQTIEGVKTFFGYFGNGDPMKGFGNFANILIKALPALLALKGIMFLAAAGKSVQSLVLALTAIKGTGGGGGAPVPVGGAGGKGTPAPIGGAGGAGKFGLASFAGLALVGAQNYKINLADDPKMLAKYPGLAKQYGKNSAIVDFFTNLFQPTNNDKGKGKGKPTLQQLIDLGNNLQAPIPQGVRGFSGQTNNVTINVHGGDPKAVTSALQQYLHLNGK